MISDEARLAQIHDPERCVVPGCRWWTGGTRSDPAQSPAQSCYGGSTDPRCGLAWVETFLDLYDDEVNPPQPPSYGVYLEQLEHHQPRGDTLMSERDEYRTGDDHRQEAKKLLIEAESVSAFASTSTYAAMAAAAQAHALLAINDSLYWLTEALRGTP